MAPTETWELRFKACSAVAAVASAASIVIGGVVGLHTYREQVLTTQALKEKELRFLRYTQKKEVYYQLADAAAAVATSTSKDEADKNATRYMTLYYGRAHIFATDRSVSDAKIEFRKQLDAELPSSIWPSTNLKSAALALTNACKAVLEAEEELLVGTVPRKDT